MLLVINSSHISPPYSAWIESSPLLTRASQPCVTSFLTWTVAQGSRFNIKHSLCRSSGEQKPPGDFLGMEEHLKHQLILLLAGHIFTGSRAQGLLHSPREVSIPIVRWNTNSQVDEVENAAGTVKGSQSISFPLLKTITYAWLISVPCSTTHELHAHPSVVKPIYLVQLELMHSVYVQVWTDRRDSGRHINHSTSSLLLF